MMIQPSVRPQLDGLRALAMVGVLYVHFWNNTPVIEHVRVSLFFVISGFLITHILVSAKERGGTIVVRNFYVRRGLRLFPPLFVAFSFAWAIDADDFRASAMWHLLPTSNIYFALHETFKPWVVAHLWSLNVLEQFYLTWPLIILYLSQGALHVVVVLGIAALTFVRVYAETLGIGGWWIDMVFSFDPILMGALAYLVQCHLPARVVLTSRPILALSAVVLVSPLFLWPDFGHSVSYRFFAQAAVAVFVVGAFQGFGGPLGWVLQSPPARFLAKISYGVYVYHLLAWYAVVQFYPQMFDHSPLTFGVMTCVTVALATLSWYAIEAPVGRLKRFFPVRMDPVPSVGTDQPA